MSWQYVHDPERIESFLIDGSCMKRIDRENWGVWLEFDAKTPFILCGKRRASVIWNIESRVELIIVWSSPFPSQSHLGLILHHPPLSWNIQLSGFFLLYSVSYCGEGLSIWVLWEQLIWYDNCCTNRVLYSCCDLIYCDATMIIDLLWCCDINLLWCRDLICYDVSMVYSIFYMSYWCCWDLF